MSVDFPTSVERACTTRSGFTLVRDSRTHPTPLPFLKTTEKGRVCPIFVWTSVRDSEYGSVVMCVCVWGLVARGPCTKYWCMWSVR